MSIKAAFKKIISNEKQWAATSSVVAAFGLTCFKIIIGFATGSLGILAEAAHSGIDLIAAAITAFAVKKSDEPADREHPYGHAKIENLSAFIETILLLLTCFLIVTAAIKRIISGRLDVEVTIWSFIVMLTSILIDVSRSRRLAGAARRYKSQALEADALHFSTDIWSSAVVIVGLICVKLSEWLKGYEFLHYADAIAAIIVGLIVIQIIARLGMRAINALIDTAPPGLDRKIILAVEALPKVNDCHHVRIRSFGNQCFIDLHIHVEGAMPLRSVHDLTEEIERTIQKFVPNADITVHPEPK